MKAPKGFETVPIEYRETHAYPDDCKVMWWTETFEWNPSEGSSFWDSDDTSIEWAIESSAVVKAVKPATDYSETVLRRIEKKCHGENDAGRYLISAATLLVMCKQIRSDIKKMKGNK